MSQSESQQRILSAYERFPTQLSQIRLDVTVSGVYAQPDEWRTLDEANPGIFTYNIRFQEAELPKGRIVPRELTDKEKKEIEDQLAEKNKKKAPPAKKDAKQPEIVQISPEEELKLKQQRELEEEEERKRQEEWAQLSEETKFYRTSEDRYKCPSLQFEKQDFSIEKDGLNLVILEERVYEDQGDFIFLVRQPTMGEEELVKFRKSKPKTLPNLNELSTIILRGWINYTPFQQPAVQESIQRIKIEQYQDEYTPADIPKPKLENTYVLLKISLNNPITPVRKEPRPQMQDVVPLAPGVKPLHPSQLCIKELRAELELIMESLAMEYSSMFGRELNQYQESKLNNMLHTHKKNDLQKRKEHFLYDFNISGKYKILKERIKKSIVKICRDKFGKSGAITGITTGQQDQFYSELYVFLMEEMRRVIIDLVKDKKEILQEDQLNTKEFASKNIDSMLQNSTKETKFEVLTRLAEEYETLNNNEKADKHYKQLRDINPTDHVCMFQYSQFALRAGNFQSAEELLEKALSYNNDNKDYQLLLAALYMRRENHKAALVIIRLLLEFDPDNLLWNLFSYLQSTTQQQKDDQLSKKILSKCERIFQREKNLINPPGQHKEKPNVYDFPWIKIPVPPPEKPEKDKTILEKQEQQKIAAELAHQQPKLTTEQQDEMFLVLIQYLEQQNQLDLASKALNFIQNQNQPYMIFLKAKIAAFKKEYQKSVEIMDTFLKTNPNSYDVILAKGNLQYVQEQFEEAEQTFLRALKMEEGKSNFQLYLRLGYLYLSKQQFGDARALFTKAIELRGVSSLAWLGLGIACNQSQLYSEAQLALTQANICEPTNSDVWAYLALNALQDGGRMVEANQALRELQKLEVYKNKLLMKQFDNEQISTQIFQLYDKLKGQEL